VGEIGCGVQGVFDGFEVGEFFAVVEGDGVDGASRNAAVGV